MCHIVQNTHVIFIGEVVEIQAEPISNETYQKSAREIAMTPQYDRVRFLIKEKFKGKESGFEILSLTRQIFSCDEVFNFKLGEKWLIFAHLDKRLGSDYMPARATRLVNNEAAKTISKLRQIRDHGIQPGIFGQFSMNYPGSLIGLKDYPVMAFSADQKFTTKMDKFGQFAFPLLPPQEYQVRIFLPYDGFVQGINAEILKFSFDNNRKSHFYEYETAVSEGKCNYESIRGHPVETN